ncbi:MAG: hypothetical protein AAF569_00115 [Pseudomonadota bacterium]
MVSDFNLNSAANWLSGDPTQGEGQGVSLESLTDQFRGDTSAIRDVLRSRLNAVITNLEVLGKAGIEPSQAQLQSFAQILTQYVSLDAQLTMNVPRHQQDAFHQYEQMLLNGDANLQLKSVEGIASADSWWGWAGQTLIKIIDGLESLGVERESLAMFENMANRWVESAQASPEDGNGKYIQADEGRIITGRRPDFDAAAGISDSAELSLDPMVGQKVLEFTQLTQSLMTELDELARIHELQDWQSSVTTTDPSAGSAPRPSARDLVPVR